MEKNRVYLGVKTCEVFLCFVAIVRVRAIVLTSLFSLFYVTGEGHRFLHRGWAKKSRFDPLHARKVSTFFPQMLMGGQQTDTRARTCEIGVFVTSFLSLAQRQASLKSVCFCLPPLLFQRNQINSLRNGLDYDLKQIENAFRDPEDGFWEKNSSEGIVGNSEVY